MKQLKAKLLKMSDSRKAGIIILVIGLVFAALGVVTAFGSMGEFDALSGKGSSTEILYLEGPCCGYYDENDRLEAGLYGGVDKTDYYILVASSKESGINLYGVDFNTQEELDKLGYVHMFGKPVEIDDDLAYYVADFYQISTSEVYDYFGYYYLDTTQSAISGYAIMAMIFGVIILITGIATLFNSKKKVKAVEEEFAKLENDSNYMDIEQSFEGETITYQNLLISSDYLIELGAKGNLNVYNLKDYSNVYKCNIVNGTYSFNSFIALENEQGRFLVGSTAKENEAFYSTIQYLKDHVGTKEEQ